MFSYTAENHTYVFVDLLKELNTGIAMIPLVSILSNVAVAKSFGRCYFFGIAIKA